MFLKLQLLLPDGRVVMEGTFDLIPSREMRLTTPVGTGPLLVGGLKIYGVKAEAIIAHD